MSPFLCNAIARAIFILLSSAVPMRETNCDLRRFTAFSGSPTVIYTLARYNVVSVLFGSTSRSTLRVGIARIGDLAASARAFSRSNVLSLDLCARPRKAASIALPACPCLSKISPKSTQGLLISGWSSVIFRRICSAFLIAGAVPSLSSEPTLNSCKSISSGFDWRASSRMVSP